MNTDLFGPAVFTYTRQQAIEDGVLVDLSQAIKPCPFKYPVAMTRAAWAATIEAGGSWVTQWDAGRPNGESLQLPDGQDVTGRVHDVFTMLLHALRSVASTDRVAFTVVVTHKVTSSVTQRRHVRLWSHCGPGDHREPVITIMLEGED